MRYLDLGTRNKPTGWEYLCAYSFIHTKLPATKYKITDFFAYGEGIPNHHCHSTNEMKKNIDIMISEFEKGVYTSSFFSKFLATYTIPFQRLQKICVSNFGKDNNASLAKKFEAVNIALSTCNNTMLMALYSMYFNKYFEKELKKVLTLQEQKNPNLFLSLQSFLLVPQKPTFPQLEEIRIYELAKQYVESVFSPEKQSFEVFIHKAQNYQQLQKLIQDFGWFHMEYDKEPFTEKDYKNYIWETINNARYDVSSPRQVILNAQKEQKLFFAKYKNTQKLKDLCRVLQEFAFHLDNTKMFLVKGIYTSRPLYQEVARRLNITEDELRYLVFPEVVTLLQTNNKADKKLIATRKKHRAIVVKNGKIMIYEGQKAQNLANRYIKSPSVTHVQEVKGIPGYPGVVTGKVGIVHGIDNRGNFQRGDILVTHDGTAEITVLLKEAAAIVTDQGGMICHAAIIAREMQTPAVLGTQFATQVFKDGDMVEVDSQKGIVRKISK